MPAADSISGRWDSRFTTSGLKPKPPPPPPDGQAQDVVRRDRLVEDLRDGRLERRGEDRHETDQSESDHQCRRSRGGATRIAHGVAAGERPRLAGPFRDRPAQQPGQRPGDQGAQDPDTKEDHHRATADVDQPVAPVGEQTGQQEFITVFPSPGLEPVTASVALRAFPAAIIGGLDSTGGAVVGGVVVGVAEVLTQGYASELSFLGLGFHTVMPYVVMVLVLLARPSGLFGTRELHRV